MGYIGVLDMKKLFFVLLVLAACTQTTPIPVNVQVEFKPLTMSPIPNPVDGIKRAVAAIKDKIQESVPAISAPATAAAADTPATPSLPTPQPNQPDKYWLPIIILSLILISVMVLARKMRPVEKPRKKKRK
jgi:hypothetical protein